MRHGESETNKTSCWTGWLDAPLTECGIEDARRAGEQLSCRSFDKVYSSDLIRARKTAEIALPGCNPELSPLLREIRLGDLEGRPLTDLTPEMREAHPEGYAAFGGEDFSELKERVKAFLSILEGDAESCQSIAVFSHGGWLKSAFSTVLGEISRFSYKKGSSSS